MCLKSRVEKAKKLNFSHIPGEGEFGCWSAKSERAYHQELKHRKGTVETPDGKKTISVFLADCQQIKYGQYHNCPGNERHTVCYHCLGAIYWSFKNSGKLVSFFETYESASRMSFGGKIAKIQSNNGKGFLWCVVKDWPKNKILSAEENINLMRGSNDDEVID